MERVESSPPTCPSCGLIPLVPRLTGATELVAASPGMQSVLRRVARFAGSDAPVAVLGETGTGKEVIARVLHANSARASAPFVPVNVAALPAELLESELFGHGKGAFTGATNARRGLFEAAEGGTLFLDEVAELPLALQAKLLRALQDGEIRRVGENEPFAADVRIVCATHRDLAEHVKQGSFREDLYYRIKVLSVVVPPLRERREDILPIATHLLSKERTTAKAFTADAESALLSYAWPGNVRELHNAVKHGAALAIGPLVDSADLPDEVLSPTSTAPRSGAPQLREGALTLRSLAEVEREHILATLDACGGSQAEAARVLGVARNTLWRKLREYGRSTEQRD
ncbi:MAG: sigma-54 dependent transcriptional regulator [Polyangiaceae bacterium]